MYIHLNAAALFICVALSSLNLSPSLLLGTDTSTCIVYTLSCLQLCTCLESPSYPHTMRAAHCRHNVVVGGVPSEPLREGDGGLSTLGGSGVPIDQVGVGWVCTIVNGAGVLWLI